MVRCYAGFGRAAARGKSLGCQGLIPVTLPAGRQTGALPMEMRRKAQKIAVTADHSPAARTPGQRLRPSRGVLSTPLATVGLRPAPQTLP